MIRLRFLSALVLLGTAGMIAQAADPEPAQGKRWFKGNTHTHSLWSDGNDFPEMIVDWYRKNGYHFLALSDHNILSEGEKWMPLTEIEKRRKTIFGMSPLEKYQKRFPEAWVELRGADPDQEVRLKTLAEFRPLFEEPGAFLLIQAEEISAAYGDLPVHLNALGLMELIKPEQGDNVTDTIRKNVRAAQAQADRLDCEIMVHLNHPNFGWGVTPEDLAYAIEEEFFEVYNGHPSINHLGDETHPSDERLWDIVNTIRLGTLKVPAMMGLSTDDSHTYHGGDVRPGRGWVMVQAQSLSSDDLIHAMRRGDFYASTGVTLRQATFDKETRRCSIDVEAVEGETYQIDFIGSLRNDPDSVGVVLASSQGISASYQVTGNELYVRATVTSSAGHSDPSFKSQKKQAWTQPIGWR